MDVISYKPGAIREAIQEAAECSKETGSDIKITTSPRGEMTVSVFSKTNGTLARERERAEARREKVDALVTGFCIGGIVGILIASANKNG